MLKQTNGGTSLFLGCISLYAAQGGPRKFIKGHERKAERKCLLQHVVPVPLCCPASHPVPQRERPCLKISDGGQASFFPAL